MNGTRRRNLTLLGAAFAILALLMLLLPVFAASGDYGMTSGGHSQPATATQISATATPGGATATPVTPTPTPVATMASCPDGHTWVPNEGACVQNSALVENRRHSN